MTLITFRDGRPILIDGYISTGCLRCEDCDLSCALYVEGRNTLEGGTEVISIDPLIVENWGHEVSGGAIFGAYSFLSDGRDLEVIFNYKCEICPINMNIEIGEKVPGGSGPYTSFRRFATAVADLGPDGCPTGIEFGELTESTGPDFTLPTLEWVCT